MCKPVTATKGTACKPHMLTKETQTGESFCKNNQFCMNQVALAEGETTAETMADLEEKH